jgi:hypothetical protein
MIRVVHRCVRAAIIERRCQLAGRFVQLYYLAPY